MLAGGSLCGNCARPMAKLCLFKVCVCKEGPSVTSAVNLVSFTSNFKGP